MLACCLRSIAVLRPMPRTASAPAFASLSCIVTPNQRTTFARLHSAYATRARRSAGGVRVKGLVPESCVTLHHPLPPPPARALSLDAKAGGSTKHRSAILHTTRAKGDGAIAGEGKLLYRSPFSLIKAFRSLALIQTAGCVAGCSAMIWQHNPINGSGDVKQMVLGISVGVFGIVAARTIGALVKRHIDSVETLGASSLRVRTLKFPWGVDEHTVSRGAFKAEVKGYNPIILGGGGARLLFVSMNDSTYVMNLKSGVVDVPACEAALNGVDEQQPQPHMLSPNAGDIGNNASPPVK